MTVVKHSPHLPPLRSLYPQVEQPPTYPLQAHTIGDLYAPLLPEQAEHTDSDLVRRCPFQGGDWVYVPRYANAIPFLYNTQNGSMFGRNLQPASYMACSPAKTCLPTIKLPDEMKWLHVLLLTRLDQSDGTKQAMVVADVLHESMPYRERRKILEKVGPQVLGIRTKPEPNTAYLVPEFTEEILEDLWAALHLMNQEPAWGAFYSGIEARGYDSKYPFQLDDPKKPCLAWHAHPFDSLV